MVFYLGDCLIYVHMSKDDSFIVIKHADASRIRVSGNMKYGRLLLVVEELMAMPAEEETPRIVAQSSAACQKRKWNSYAKIK